MTMPIHASRGWGLYRFQDQIRGVILGRRLCAECVVVVVLTVYTISQYGYSGAYSAMGTCTPQKFSIWVIAIVMYANMP